MVLVIRGCFLRLAIENCKENREFTPETSPIWRTPRFLCFNSAKNRRFHRLRLELAGRLPGLAPHRQTTHRRCSQGQP